MHAERVIIPEVVETLPPDLEALQRFARLMDEAVAIPGTNRRAGLDAALGLIPGVGDTIAALLSAWIVIGALRWRVPYWRVAQMVINILVDLSFGALPFLGDVFDFFFEENVINMRILLKHRDRHRPPRALHEIAFAAILVIVIIVGFAFALLTGLIAGVIWLIHHR